MLPFTDSSFVSLARITGKKGREGKLCLKNQGFALKNGVDKVVLLLIMDVDDIKSLGPFPASSKTESRRCGLLPGDNLRMRPVIASGDAHRPMSEPLEDRALLSLSLLSFLSPSTATTKPALSPAAVSDELPKDVSGRVAGLYEMSLSKHPQYQSVSGSRILERLSTTQPTPVPSWRISILSAQRPRSTRNTISSSPAWFWVRSMRTSKGSTRS